MASFNVDPRFSDPYHMLWPVAPFLYNYPFQTSAVIQGNGEVLMLLRIAAPSLVTWYENLFPNQFHPQLQLQPIHNASGLTDTKRGLTAVGREEMSTIRNVPEQVQDQQSLIHERAFPTIKPAFSGASPQRKGRRRRRVKCYMCMKTFCDNGSLKIHFGAVHLNHMFGCTVHGCKMVFSTHRSRNRHSANPNPNLHLPHLRRNISPDDGRISKPMPLMVRTHFAGTGNFDCPALLGNAGVANPRM